MPMGRKKVEHPIRGRRKKREARQSQRSATPDGDEEAGHETMVEYSSESSESSDAHSEYEYRLQKRRMPPQKFCFCCTKRRVRFWHDTVRDIILVCMFLLMAYSTLKDSQRQAISDLAFQVTNFTKDFSQWLQTRNHHRHAKSMQTHGSEGDV